MIPVLMVLPSLKVKKIKVSCKPIYFNEGKLVQSKNQKYKASEQHFVTLYSTYFKFNKLQSFKTLSRRVSQIVRDKCFSILHTHFKYCSTQNFEKKF